MSSNRFLTPLLAALAVIGLVLPWRYNLAYFAAGGSVLPEVFFRDAFANALTSAITLDVYLSALAFSAARLDPEAARCGLPAMDEGLATMAQITSSSACSG